MNTETSRTSPVRGGLLSALFKKTVRFISSEPDPVEQLPRRFRFDIRETVEGRKILHFPFASVSDVHWGTRACRAKRFAHMMHHTESDELHGVGDIFDLKHLQDKYYWNMGPWHRQGLAQVIRKVREGTKTLYYRGNHETGMRDIADHEAGTPAPIWRSGREIMGIKMVYDHERTDPKGRRHYILHGDVFDYGAFESQKLAGVMKALIAVTGSKKNAESFVYNVCNGAYESLYIADSLLQSIPPLEHASLAAFAKKAFKKTINEHLDIRRVITEALDESAHDVMIYGHSHMPGFDWTPGGKLLINDGCSTEHVNMLVQDEAGTFAILTWRKYGMEVEEEPAAPFASSHKYFLTWQELGLDHFEEPAVLLENNDDTARADRLLRLVYRLAPPREKKELQENLAHGRMLLEDYEHALDLGYQPTPADMMAEQRLLADCAVQETQIRKCEAALSRPSLFSAEI
ncbi:MAG: hypothetical protein LRY54_00250 [Alphaproteobacteria bacterium]|nr:hypothetical protein [Alphaproteobacteria bacterium]